MSRVPGEQQDARHTLGEDVLIRARKKNYAQPETLETPHVALLSNEASGCFHQGKEDSLQNLADSSAAADPCSPSIHRQRSEEDADLCLCSCGYTTSKHRCPEEAVFMDQDTTPGKGVSLKGQEDPTSAGELILQGQKDPTQAEEVTLQGQEETTQTEELSAKEDLKPREKMSPKEQEDLTSAEDLSPTGQEDPTPREKLNQKGQEDLISKEEVSPNGQEEPTPREKLNTKGQEDLTSKEEVSPTGQEDPTKPKEVMVEQISIPRPIALHAEVEGKSKGVGKPTEEVAPKTAGTVARKRVKGMHVPKLGIGLVSPESPDAERAWVGRHPRKCQTPHLTVEESLRNKETRLRSEGASFKDSRNAALLPQIDISSQSRHKSWSPPSKPKCGSRELSKAKSPQLPTITLTPSPLHQRHRSTSLTVLSPSAASLVRNEGATRHPPERSSGAKPAKADIKCGANSSLAQPPLLPLITFSQFVLPVSYRYVEGRRLPVAKRGILVTHPYLCPLPRRKVEGRAAELLRGVSVKPAEMKLLKASLVQPKPVNPELVLMRAVNPPFDFSLTEEQHRRFLTMYGGAKIY